jgi:hypothetical protein
MNRPVPATVALALLGALSAGCGQAEPAAEARMGAPARAAEQPEPSAEGSGAAVPGRPESVPAPDAATGVRLRGKGYVINAPGGWVETTREMREQTADIDVAAGAPLSASADFRSNLNVIVTADASITLSAYEALAPDTLKFLVERLHVLPRATVRGVEAAHVSGAARSGRRAFHLDQYAVIGGDDLFTITFASAPSMKQSVRDALMESVLATWQWT